MLMATMLAQMPDLLSRVQYDHTADRDGYCRECRDVRWPCEVFQIASDAERLGGHRQGRDPLGMDRPRQQRPMRSVPPPGARQANPGYVPDPNRRRLADGAPRAVRADHGPRY